MIQKSRNLIEDLAQIEGKAEIVQGSIVRMSPASGFHGFAARKILVSLDRHAEKLGSGVPLGDNVGFLVDLPDRESFSPDVAWIPGQASEVIDDRFVSGAPAFAVEIRSPRDRTPAGEQRVLAKIADYFAAGTLVVWDVDPLSDEPVKCYRASEPRSPQIFLRSQRADAEPAVPGWKFTVRRMFP